MERIPGEIGKKTEKMPVFTQQTHCEIWRRVIKSTPSGSRLIGKNLDNRFTSHHVVFTCLVFVGSESVSPKPSVGVSFVWETKLNGLLIGFILFYFIFNRSHHVYEKASVSFVAS
jgi:hypothetical protein